MLTLKKVQSSAAAQAVAAVADEEQLTKMIRESASVIDEKPLRTWDAEDVPAVYDSLVRVYESISKLTLAPQKSFQSFSSGIGLFAKDILFTTLLILSWNPFLSWQCFSCG